MSAARPNRTPSSVPKASGAETARKVLRVLLHFSPRRPTSTVKEIAAACDLPLATAHRYVALLRELGLVEEAGRASYQLGWRAAQLGHAASEAGGVLPVAEPVMRRLVTTTDESVTLFQRADLEMECIGQFESPHVIRLTFQPGQRLALSSGASARVLLSGLDDAALDEVLRVFAERDPTFAARRDVFEAGIVETRQRGWATSREEIDQGVWAVAAPVIVDGRVVASLAVAGPLQRKDAETERRVVAAVRDAVSEINAALQARTLA